MFRSSFLLVIGTFLLGYGCQSQKVLQEEVAPNQEVGKPWHDPDTFKQQDVVRKPLPEGPVSLKKLVDYAMHENPKIRASYYSSAYQKSLIQEARADYFPSISVSASAERSRQSSITSPNHIQTTEISSFTPQAEVNYTIYDFGKRSAKVRRAHESFEVESLNYNRLLQEVEQEVTTHYWSTVGSQQDVVNEEKNVEDLERLVEVAQARQDAGVLDRSDYLQARSNYLSAKIRLSEEQNTQKKNLNKLKMSIGVPVEERLEVAAIFPEKIDLTDYSVKQLAEDALQARPDLLALQSAIIGEKASVSEYRAEFFPTLSLTASYDKPYYSRGPSPSYEVTGQVAISYDIFEGFKRFFQVEAAKQKVLHARSKLRAKEVMLSQEVASAWEDVQQASREYALTAEYLESANEAFNIAMEKFSGGLSSVIDVLTAQNSLASARKQWTGARKGYFMALANLSFYTGKPIGEHL